MTAPKVIYSLVVLACVLGLLAWLAKMPEKAPATASASTGRAQVHFRLGLIPDRNLFEQRASYQALAEYLDAHVRLNREPATANSGPQLHVDLVTSSNYAGILKDYDNGEVDGAFLGSLVAVLVFDRSGGQVLTKSQNLAGKDTYAGTIFTLESSPIKTIGDLRGKKLGAVRTTMAGAFFPLIAIKQAGFDAKSRPELLWTGTHDDVIDDVVAGAVDAGAVKDLRLDAYEREHPDVKFRRIATGPRAPDNALVVSRTLAPETRGAIVACLLGMANDPDGAAVLEKMKLRQFTPCTQKEYKALYDMVDEIRPNWSECDIEGPAPKRPGGL